MIKKINLNFGDESIYSLAGFDVGDYIYTSQVKDQVDALKPGDKIEISFPKQIERVASSFVQGFFSDSVNTYGFDAVEDMFTIRVESPNLSESMIWKKLTDI